MSFWTWLFLASGAAYLASRAATGIVLKAMRGRHILDRPSPRSSHAVPTPIGGGLAVSGVVLAAWVLIALAHADPPAAAWVMPAAALGLAALSWLDDLRGLAVPIRLGAQFLAVAAGLAVFPGIGQVFQGVLPGWLDVAATAVIWVWFVNLFNFMDGIDGISGVETACIGLGLAAVALIVPLGGAFAFYGATLAAAALGFLAWNWHPARIFLGDVGSVPLGFLAGWLLLAAAAAGYWAAALILPLYYLADATLTLLWRALKRERVWQAHKQHFYQRAHQGGLRHDEVVLRIMATNLVLVPLALFSLWAAALPFAPWLALAAAVAAVGGLLGHLGRRRSG
jgi:UDP-N-acetylmuramyl pentapeptide phosphotransferase/UDP-N-acetylglucosamine-1-phosphate transferase